MGEHLAASEMTVLGIRLRGHGTRVEDMQGVRWQGWVEDVSEGLAELRHHQPGNTASAAAPQRQVILVVGLPAEA